ncbi:MAG TPA: hypothetical protein VK327_12675 [Candidatus Paceibacterota bacterium]|nr:hypothetical protein [Candidatus Paceibacterota bacterium]
MQRARQTISRFDFELNAVRSQMAAHLIGNAVDLMTRSKTILHGTVTGVLTEAGKPKVVVNGRRYDMNQIVTVLPATFN